MFLRNYDNMIQLYHDKDHIGLNATQSGEHLYSSKALFGDGYLNAKTANGSIVGFNTGIAKSSSAAVSRGFFVFGPGSICLGTGNTPVTYDDFKLSGDLVANKLIEIEDSAQMTYDTDKKCWKHVFQATYSNTTDTNLTISEWGLFRTQNGSAAKAYAEDGSSVLLFREVLSAPVVIAAGTTGTLTFEMELPMTNYSA